MNKKISVNLNILGEELEIKIDVPNDFENLSDYEQMCYIEYVLKTKINYTWDY